MNRTDNWLKMWRLSMAPNKCNYIVFSNDKLQKYEHVEDIINDYMEVRMRYYDLRKINMVKVLEMELHALSTKVRYISEVLAGTIDLRNKKKAEIHRVLSEKGFESCEYLLKLPMDSVSDENVCKLQDEFQGKEKELQKLSATSIQEMWLSELHSLKDRYLQYQSHRSVIPAAAAAGGGGGGGNSDVEKRKREKK